MSEPESQTLNGVSETSFTTLHVRAMESQRPDALIKDEKAVELVTRLGDNFDRVRRIPMSDANRLVISLRNREIDRYARDFLARQPDAVVVHIGCGLDSRFDRVDNCYSPSHRMVHNFQVTTLGHTARAHWGIWHGQEIERWGNGIRLLGEWGFFDEPEPRLHSFRWMAPIFRLLKPFRVFHFQLGKAAR